MESIQAAIDEYKKQIEKGYIQKAYRGLMDFILSLRTHLMKKHTDLIVSGNIYYGYMDMTYFSVSPKPLLDRKLKIAIVFLHEEFRFEVWLSGVNRQAQKQYWKFIKESNWNKYKIVPQGAWVDSILEHILISNPDFNDLDTLTQQIEKGTLKFIKDVENFLTNH